MDDCIHWYWSPFKFLWRIESILQALSDGVTTDENFRCSLVFGKRPSQEVIIHTHLDNMYTCIVIYVCIYIYKYEINFYFPLATGNYGQRLAALLGILYWWIVVRVTCELHLRDIKWYSLHTFNLHVQICGQGTIYIYKHILPPSTCQKRTHTQKKRWPSTNPLPEVRVYVSLFSIKLPQFHNHLRKSFTTHDLVGIDLGVPW